MKIAAIYARVSGERQRDDNTIASQTEALIAYAEDHGYSVAPDMIIEDDGYTGAVLERPGLERVRDLAAEGRIDTVLVHAPDRMSRRYAYQVLIIEELARQGVETVFLRAPSMETPEDHRDYKDDLTFSPRLPILQGVGRETQTWRRRHLAKPIAKALPWSNSWTCSPTKRRLPHGSSRLSGRMGVTARSAVPSGPARFRTRSRCPIGARTAGLTSA